MAILRRRLIHGTSNFEQTYNSTQEGKWEIAGAPKLVNGCANIHRHFVGVMDPLPCHILFLYVFLNVEYRIYYALMRMANFFFLIYVCNDFNDVIKPIEPSTKLKFLSNFFDFTPCDVNISTLFSSNLLRLKE